MPSPSKDEKAPRLCLISPADIDLKIFPDRLAKILDAQDFSCLRLRLSSRDESHIARIADHLRPLCHDRDVTILIDTHSALVKPLGLDGVHICDDLRPLAKIRKALGEASLIGAGCAASRHEGLCAGEKGADYVSFGPVGQTRLGAAPASADYELFAWWSELIEIPVIAEGHLSVGLVEKLASVVDFFAIGDEIWNTECPLKSLSALLAPIRA